MSTIPTIPMDKIADGEGNINPDWQQFFVQLLLYLNTNLSSEGYVAPSLTTSDISALNDAENGTIVYDSDTEQFKGKENGSFKVFTLV